MLETIFILLTIVSIYLLYKMILPSSVLEWGMLTVISVIFGVMFGFFYLLIISFQQEKAFIIDHQCVYTGQNKTEYITTTTLVGNTPIVQLTPYTTYFWKCDDGAVHGFGISPK